MDGKSEKAISDLSKTLRKFFAELLNIKYQFTYDELNQELFNHNLDWKFRAQIDKFFKKLSEMEFGGRELTDEEVDSAARQAEAIILRLSGYVEERPKSKAASWAKEGIFDKIKNITGFGRGRKKRPPHERALEKVHRGGRRKKPKPEHEEAPRAAKPETLTQQPAMTKESKPEPVPQATAEPPPPPPFEAKKPPATRPPVEPFKPKPAPEEPAAAIPGERREEAKAEGESRLSRLKAPLKPLKRLKPKLGSIRRTKPFKRPFPAIPQRPPEYARPVRGKAGREDLAQL